MRTKVSLYCREWGLPGGDPNGRFVEGNIDDSFFEGCGVSLSFERVATETGLVDTSGDYFVSAVLELSGLENPIVVLERKNKPESDLDFEFDSFVEDDFEFGLDVVVPSLAADGWRLVAVRSVGRRSLLRPWSSRTEFEFVLRRQKEKTE